MPRTYDPEFRQRVVELVRAGRPVRVVAAELGLAEATVYRWKAQDLIDRGSSRAPQPASAMSWLRPGDASGSWRPSRSWSKQAAKLFEEGAPKATYPVIARAGRARLLGRAMLPHPRRDRLRLLQVAAPVALTTPAPLRLADRVVRAIHADSRGTYGWRRVNAELVYGHGVVVNRKTVRKIIRAQGLHGLPGPRKGFRSKANIAIAADLVERRFDRPAPDQLWVTDISEHPHPRGQGVLLCGAGCVLPPGGGLGDRQPPGDPAGHQRPGHGHHQPQPATSADGDP